MPNPTPKGKRVAHCLRMPFAHDRVYKAKAQEVGMDYNTYIAWCLAKLHDLQWPPPLKDDQKELSISNVA